MYMRTTEGEKPRWRQKERKEENRIKARGRRKGIYFIKRVIETQRTHLWERTDKKGKGKAWKKKRTGCWFCVIWRLTHKRPHLLKKLFLSLILRQCQLDYRRVERDKDPSTWLLILLGPSAKPGCEANPAWRKSNPFRAKTEKCQGRRAFHWRRALPKLP